MEKNDLMIGLDAYGFSAFPAGYDAYGFSALPAGYADQIGNILYINRDAFFWYATEFGLHCKRLHYRTERFRAAIWGDNCEYYAYSIRCLKDTPEYLEKEAKKKAAAEELKKKIEYAREKIKENSGEFTDSRDGQVYKTIKIGNQTWFAENLNFKTERSYCYENDESNAEKYGRLYTWGASQTACPPGWHLPTREEWEELEKYIRNELGLSENTKIGTYLKSASGWEEDSETPVGLDTYGFAALPAGNRSSEGDYEKVGEETVFWTATEDEYNNKNAYELNPKYGCYCFSSHKDNAYSVRCLKDTPEYLEKEAKKKAAAEELKKGSVLE